MFKSTPKREPFHPLAKLDLSGGSEAWTGDLVRLRPNNRRETSGRTFGVPLSGDWETAIFLGVADPSSPEIVAVGLWDREREVVSSDSSTLVLAFFVNGSGLLMLSKEAIRLLEIQLVRDNQGELLRCIDQKVVRLFPFEIDRKVEETVEDFSASARVLNPYWLPVDLQQKDPEYFVARVRDLGILRSQYSDRRSREKARPEALIYTRIGNSKGPEGPVFSALTIGMAHKALKEFVETFGSSLIVVKIVTK